MFIDQNFKAYDFKLDIYDIEIGGVFKHIGIYGYTKETLFSFTALSPSENEKKYSLEQFRALDNGIKIKSLITNSEHISVDVPEDINKILKRVNKNDTKLDHMKNE